MYKIYCLFNRVEIAPEYVINEVVYVGRSKNVKSRITKHKQTKVFDSYGIFEEVETLEEAKIREDLYIRHHNPKFNRCLNKTGVYRKMEEILEENELDLKEAGELIHQLIKRKVEPVFADNYKPMEIYSILSSVRFGGYYRG